MTLDQKKLEAAAETILGALQPQTADILKESALVYSRIPLWVLVAGLLIHCYENGTYTTPTLDPSWPRVFTLPDLMKDTKCEWCDKMFSPRRYKQRFCSSECGTEFQVAEAQTA